MSIGKRPVGWSANLPYLEPPTHTFIFERAPASGMIVDHETGESKEFFELGVLNNFSANHPLVNLESEPIVLRSPPELALNERFRLGSSGGVDFCFSQVATSLVTIFERNERWKRRSWLLEPLTTTSPLLTEEPKESKHYGRYSGPHSGRARI